MRWVSQHPEPRMRAVVEVRWIEESDVEDILELIASAGLDPTLARHLGRPGNDRRRCLGRGEVDRCGSARRAGAGGRTRTERIRAGNQTVVAVVPEYRSRGVGAQMQQELLKSRCIRRDDRLPRGSRESRISAGIGHTDLCLFRRSVHWCCGLRTPPSGSDGARWLALDEIGPRRERVDRTLLDSDERDSEDLCRVRRDLWTSGWQSTRIAGCTRFGVIAVDGAYAAVGVGKLHSVGDRLELLELGGFDDEANYERLIDAVQTLGKRVPMRVRADSPLG